MYFPIVISKRKKEKKEEDGVDWDNNNNKKKKKTKKKKKKKTTEWFGIIICDIFSDYQFNFCSAPHTNLHFPPERTVAATHCHLDYIWYTFDIFAIK